MDNKRQRPEPVWQAYWTDDPYAHCPRCDEDFYVRDSFENSIGSEEECPKCGLILEQIDEEMTRRWCWREKA